MQTNHNVKVCIIGAGPAGLITALSLAKNNISTLLIEKEQFPRAKTCGDAITGRALFLINSVDKKLFEQIYNDTKFNHVHGLNCFVETLLAYEQNNYKENEYYPIVVGKREHFDNILMNEAKSNSLITILENTKAVSYEYHKQSFTITAQTLKNTITITSSLLIDSQGVYSSFKKAYLNLKSDTNKMSIAARGYFTTKSKSKNNHIEFYFLKELLPGYLWIFDMSNNTSNIGFITSANNLKRIKKNHISIFKGFLHSYPQLSERFEYNELDIEMKSHLLPMQYPAHSLSGNNYMLTGDAASLVNPITGEGISFALQSGICAAEIAQKAVEQNKFDANFLLQYDNLISEQIGSELLAAQKMQQFMMYPKLFKYILQNAKNSTTCAKIFNAMFVEHKLQKNIKHPLYYASLTHCAKSWFPK